MGFAIFKPPLWAVQMLSDHMNEFKVLIAPSIRTLDMLEAIQLGKGKSHIQQYFQLLTLVCGSPPILQIFREGLHPANLLTGDSNVFVITEMK